MTLIRHTAAALCAGALAIVAPLSGGLPTLFPGSLAAAALDDDVTLKGCLIKGDGDGAGYLLTNTMNDPGWQRSTDAAIRPSSVGTTGGFDSIFYWLDGDKDLEKNVGREVQISGDLKGDLKDGEIEMDRKDNWTEMTVKSDGRTMKAKVPNTSLMPAPHQDDDRKARVIVRRVDVENVKMLSAACGEMR